MINEVNYGTKATKLRSHISSNRDNQSKYLAFFVATLIFLAVSLSINTEIFRGDARLYWALSADILKGEFPTTYRGYFYPLLLVPGRWFFDNIPELGLLPLKLMQSAIYAYLLTSTLGNIYIRTIGGKSSFLRRLTPAALTAIFFPGLITYPLSDLPAFLLLLSAIGLILSAYTKTLTWPHLTVFFIAGILAYASYNTRTIYIFGFAFLSINIFITGLRQGSRLKGVLPLIIFLAGAAFAAIPQMAINTKNFNKSTPLVITDTGDKSLFAYQLLWGITTERYETVVAPGAKVGTPTYYQDAQGVSIFNEYQLGSAEFSIATYTTIAAKEPLVFIGIFIRHLINGLDARDGIVYASSPSKDKTITSIACFTLLFLSALTLTYRDNKKANEPFCLILLSLIIPTLAITLGAVETRFFYPIHALAYATIAFALEQRLVVGLPKRSVCTALIFYLVFAATWISITQTTLQNPIFEFPAAFKGS
ncbi:hypothetical protein J2X84_004540 [Pseudomonas corrugata]|uniref:hypothetical protein n=1 Tax=Pseudomonas corrugata TaxID=47879 RepID=UPI0028649323|nr:hypothetical protein [Pseudomonas corrugata]MDR7285690.1 hypothetical protein [Pseudomonas corrugata]